MCWLVDLLTELEFEDHFEPDVVAFESLLGFDFVQPFQLREHINFANLVDIGDDRTKARGAALEITEVRPGAAVASNLLIPITIYSDTREPATQRQVLGQRTRRYGTGRPTCSSCPGSPS